MHESIAQLPRGVRVRVDPCGGSSVKVSDCNPPNSFRNEAQSQRLSWYLKGHSWPRAELEALGGPDLVPTLTAPILQSQTAIHVGQKHEAQPLHIFAFFEAWAFKNCRLHSQQHSHGIHKMQEHGSETLNPRRILQSLLASFKPSSSAPAY